MHKFTLNVKRMFLSGSSSKVYALLYREQIKRLKNDIQDIAGEHPLRKVLKFMGQVAFFGQNDDVDGGKQGQAISIY